MYLILMHCPKCDHPDTKVIDSRLVKDFSVRRRRTCLECAHRFSTVEEVLRECTYVIKRDGTREPFARSKIISGVYRAIEKRPVTEEQINALASNIEEFVDRQGEVSTECIGKMLMDGLMRLDPVSYVRFASVYQDFSDVKAFQEAVSAIEPPA